MKASVFNLIFCLIACVVQSQSQNLNYRYWQMRQRLLDRFVVVGDCHGCSLPATRYHVGKNQLVFEDETVRQLGWYIAVLASENHLLKSSGAGSDRIQQNMQELYHAARAFDRFDKYAEFLWCVDNNIEDNLGWNGVNYVHINISEKCEEGWNSPEYNLNGFFIREDVPPYFEQHFPPGTVVKHGEHEEGINTGWIANNQFTRCAVRMPELA